MELTSTAANANAASLLGGTENDTFNFSGNVRDSSIVGGRCDSLVLGDASGDFVRGSTIYGGSPSNGASELDGADYISVAGSLSSSAIYGNSGADSLFVGSNATVIFEEGADNDLVSVSANVSAGHTTGSGVDSVIITGSLTGSATVRLTTLVALKRLLTASQSLTSVAVLFMANLVLTRHILVPQIALYLWWRPKRFCCRRRKCSFCPVRRRRGC